MSLMIGIVAASGAGAAPAFELISTAYGTGSSSTITLSSIPADYKHLQIRGVARSGTQYGSTAMYMRLNGATSGYAWHELYGDGSSVASSSGTADTKINVGTIPSVNGTAGAVGAFVIDILDYASTSKNKTVRTFYGVTDSANSNTTVALRSGFLTSTSAVSSVSFIANSSLPFTSLTRISIYGIKG